jgi:hypothetical protein
MRASKSFTWQELVSREVFQELGERCSILFDRRIIDVLQELRDIFEELYPNNTYIVVNNWNSGGQRQQSGYRHRDTSVGAEYSQHRFGRAVDVQVFVKNSKGTRQLTSKEVNDVIFKNKKRLMDKGLTTVENFAFTNGWNHLDCRHTGMSDLLVVNP